MSMSMSIWHLKQFWPSFGVGINVQEKAGCRQQTLDSRLWVVCCRLQRSSRQSVRSETYGITRFLPSFSQLFASSSIRYCILYAATVCCILYGCSPSLSFCLASVFTFFQLGSLCRFSYSLHSASATFISTTTATATATAATTTDACIYI